MSGTILPGIRCIAKHVFIHIPFLKSFPVKQSFVLVSSSANKEMPEGGSLLTTDPVHVCDASPMTRHPIAFSKDPKTIDQTRVIGVSTGTPQ